jgi:hypothetical protein
LPTEMELWTSPGWRAAAVAWIDEQLAGVGATRSGEIGEGRVRPWSVVLEVPTSQGVVWFKAPGKGTVFEVGLYQLLCRIVPSRVLLPLATDTERGWLLLPHGGTTLRALLKQSAGDLASSRAFERALPQYAALQRALTPHVADLSSLGVVDMCADVMPRRFDEALQAAQPYLEACGSADERAAYERAVDTRSAFSGWCNELAGAPVAASLDHNDLHSGNVFVSGPAGALQARFYDWGDSVISHPFASMLEALRGLGNDLGCGPRDPRLLAARDAYLEVWSDQASHAELVQTLALACQVAKVARALTWARAVASAGSSADLDFRSAPFRHLTSLVEGNPFAR